MCNYWLLHFFVDDCLCYQALCLISFGCIFSLVFFLPAKTLRNYLSVNIFVSKHLMGHFSSCAVRGSSLYYQWFHQHQLFQCRTALGFNRSFLVNEDHWPGQETLLLQRHSLLLSLRSTVCLPLNAPILIKSIFFYALKVRLRHLPTWCCESPLSGLLFYHAFPFEFLLFLLLVFCPFDCEHASYELLFVFWSQKGSLFAFLHQTSVKFYFAFQPLLRYLVINLPLQQMQYCNRAKGLVWYKTTVKQRQCCHSVVKKTPRFYLEKNRK